MSALAFVNLAATATIAPSTTFSEVGWPAANVQRFGRPHLRAYSASLSAQRFTFDFGVAASLGMIALWNPNFTTVTIQGNSADTWGAPAYTSGLLTMAYAGNDRIHHAHRPSAAAPFLRRYLSLSIPAQATTDGATQFRLGPVWAGALVALPGELLPDPDDEKVDAVEDVTTPDGRVFEHLVLDDPAWRFSGRVVAETETEYTTWRSIYRQWSAAPGQAALFLLGDSRPEDVYLVRKQSSRWRRGTFFMESDIELLEVTSG